MCALSGAHACICMHHAWCQIVAALWRRPRYWDAAACTSTRCGTFVETLRSSACGSRDSWCDCLRWPATLQGVRVVAHAGHSATPRWWMSPLAGGSRLVDHSRLGFPTRLARCLMCNLHCNEQRSAGDVNTSLLAFTLPEAQAFMQATSVVSLRHVGLGRREHRQTQADTISRVLQITHPGSAQAEAEAGKQRSAELRWEAGCEASMPDTSSASPRFLL